MDTIGIRRFQVMYAELIKMHERHIWVKSKWKLKAKMTNILIWRYKLLLISGSQKLRLKVGHLAN